MDCGMRNVYRGYFVIDFLQGFGRQAWGMFLLLRPFNFFGFMAGVLLSGFVIAGFQAFQEPYGGRLFLAAVSAALIGGAANTLNDVFDFNVDVVNRPNRPLPSGIISIQAARWMWMILSLAGVVLSMFISSLHLIMAVGFVLALYSYNAFLKSTVLWGNLIVSFLVACGFFYGGLTVGTLQSLLVGAVFAFLFIFAREIIKDIEDKEGDIQLGIRTLPIAYGTRPALIGASIVLVLIILLTPLPFLMFNYGSLYLFIVLVADGLLLWTLGVLFASTPTNKNRKASTIVKWTMIVGMGALACAGVGG